MIKRRISQLMFEEIPPDYDDDEPVGVKGADGNVSGCKKLILGEKFQPLVLLIQRVRFQNPGITSMNVVFFLLFSITL